MGIIGKRAIIKKIKEVAKEHEYIATSTRGQLWFEKTFPISLPRGVKVTYIYSKSNHKWRMLISEGMPVYVPFDIQFICAVSSLAGLYEFECNKKK